MLNSLNRRTFLARLLVLGLLSFTSFEARAADRDPLPSWNDGPTKQSILDFVTAVTKEGGPDYVEPAERVATFDNDGTLWIEQPIYNQFIFAIDRVKATSNKRPEWKTQEPFASILKGDLKALAASGEKGMLEIVAATHSGMTTADFNKTVKEWLATAKHPRFKMLYTDLVYQPMMSFWTISAPMASRPSSCLAVGWSSCAPSPTRPMEYRRSKSLDRRASPSIRCGTQARC